MCTVYVPILENNLEKNFIYIYIYIYIYINREFPDRPVVWAMLSLWGMDLIPDAGLSR